MKREGRQHGMVKSHPNPMMSAPLNQHPRRRESNGLNPVAPTADLFTKVPTKPTNHSKFTGNGNGNGKCGQTMCRECHLSPPSKSKDKPKAKGPQRLRSSFDVVSDYKLISWRVVDLKLSGFSATRVLDYMDHYYGGDEEEQNVTNHEIEEVVECKAKAKNNEINSQNINDDVCVSFCDVGFAWQLENGDEDWYLV